MAKFKITDLTNNVVPEDSGWVWCSEDISEPSPRYIFAKVMGANGLVDMSAAASGALRYNDRTITVTFARFKKGQDNWLENVNSLVTSIKTIMGTVGQKYVFPKTEMYRYEVYGWDYKVSRDGIIQFLTLTFKCAPIGTVHT